MDLIRLWTIKSEAQWVELQEQGTLRADARLVAEEWWAGSWQPAYDWMVAQMEERLGPPPPGCAYPIWAWRQWGGAAKPRPDLRSADYRHSSGVRLELELPRSLVLLSDFDRWHFPLGCSYLPASEEDAAAFDQLLAAAGLDPEWPLSRQELPPDLRARVEASWARIFDLDWADPYISVPRDQKRIQAVMWELSRDQVRRVTPFAGWPRRPYHGTRIQAN